MGYTSDLNKRSEEYNAGANTSAKTYQWEHVYYEAYLDKDGATQRETQLKRNRKVKTFLLK